MYFCKLFDGARHDSGDPFDWGEKLLAHYRANRVDPRTKTLVFSDGLDRARGDRSSTRRFHGRCQLAFGIGTNLTNDLGYEPLNIVIKMIRVQRPAGGQALRLARQEHVQGRGLPGLPAPGVRDSRDAGVTVRAGQNAGSTAPWYFFSMNALISGLFSALASFCTRGSFWLSGRPTR